MSLISIASGHLSGLFVRLPMSAGPDEVREPDPYQVAEPTRLMKFPSPAGLAVTVRLSVHKLTPSFRASRSVLIFSGVIRSASMRIQTDGHTPPNFWFNRAFPAGLTGISVTGADPVAGRWCMEQIPHGFRSLMLAYVVSTFTRTDFGRGVCSMRLRTPHPSLASVF